MICALCGEFIHAGNLHLCKNPNMENKKVEIIELKEIIELLQDIRAYLKEINQDMPTKY